MSTEVLGAVSEKAMKLALRRGASEAQAVTYTRVEDLTRFANSQIHQNVSSVSSGLRIKVIIKKRIGDTQISALDSKSVELTVKDAIKIAKVSPLVPISVVERILQRCQQLSVLLRQR